MRTINNVAVWDRLAGRVACTFPLQTLAELPPWHGAAVADYGCGEGRALKYLADLGFRRLVGWDPAPNMAALAALLCPEAEVSSSDDTVMSRPGEFHIAVMIAVLSSVVTAGNRVLILRGLHSALAPGGLLALGDFGVSASGRYLARYGRCGLGPSTFQTEDGMVIHHFAMEELVGLAKGAGFDVVTRRTLSTLSLHGHPLPAHFVLARRY